MRPSRAGRRRRAALSSLLAVGLFACAVAVPMPAVAQTTQTAETTPTAPAVVQLCGTPAPGQASCLAERQIPSASPAAATATPATPGGLGPADLADAYQLDTSKGYGQTVAVVDAYDDPTAAADLGVYRSQYGLPACGTGCFSKVNQSGASGPLPAGNAGWAGEISLDLDMVSAICPQCNILLVEANSSYLSDLGTAVDTAVRLGAKFVSNSYGGGEYAGVGGNDVHYNHPGVAITASTGDNGYGMSYPASSPYVTAVGGTTLSRSSGGRGWTETAWAGAGSGCSGYLGQPVMQAATGTGCANRAVADVSAVANPATGVAVYNGGGWGVYGGTSASAPIIAGVYALAGTPSAADYPNSYPYQNSTSLFDVTAGSNGSCSTHQWCAAGVGWDGPTGLGSPDTAAAFSATGQVAGAPVKFGATGRVTSPMVAGLPVSLSLTPQLPDGDSLASVSWKPARTDCAIAAPTEQQTTVSCPATLTGLTSVTATVTDVLGASKAVSLPLSFSASTVKRAVSLSMAVAGQSGAGQSLCTSASTPIRAVALDTSTGLPIKGLPVTFTRQLGTALPATAGSASSQADGAATLSLSSTVAVTLGARSAAAGPFSAAAASSVPVTVAKCVPSLTGAADKDTSYYGDPVTVTGQLSRAAGTGTVPLAGAVVQVVEAVNGRTVQLGTAMAAADGSLRTVVHPTAAGTLSLALPAAVGWTATSAVLGPLTVLMPGTTLTASADRLDVGYLDAVVVSGTLLRNAGDLDSGLARALVSLRGTGPTGAISVLGSATVAADGSWSATVRPRTAGTLSAVYAGGPGLPAATAGVGVLTVGTWTTSLSLTVQNPQLAAGAADPVTGTVTREYAGASSNAPSVPVGIYLVNTLGSTTLLRTLTTNSAGQFSGTVAPVENGTLIAKVTSVAGYGNAESAPSSVSVTSKLTLTGPSVTSGGRPASLIVQLVPARAGSVSVQELVGGSWLTLATASAASTGRAAVSLSGLALGKHVLRAEFDGDSRGGAAVSGSISVSVLA
jgi:hypothetical protein